MTSQKVLEWLLDEGQPSIRYRTLTELLGRPPSDPDVRAAKERIPQTGWAAEILSERAPEGWWNNGRSLYTPKYLSTNWKLLVLSDLALTRALPSVRVSAELWMQRFAARGGALGSSSKGGTGTPHHCMAGNLARALIRFGYGDDERVRRTIEWLVTSADPKGGSSCYGSGRNLDSWEGLSALAAYPRSKWTVSMTECAERGAEFYLERALYRQGEHYEPWYRFHYPVHYYYDLLVGLELVTSLGHAADPRLKIALDVLRKKRRRDGRWNLDAVHPDLEGGTAEFYRTHPKERPTPWALEIPGQPSKMITLRALIVLDRVGAA